MADHFQVRRHVCASGAWPGDWQHTTLNPCIDKAPTQVEMHAALCIADMDGSSYSDEAIAEEGRKIEARRSREGMTSR